MPLSVVKVRNVGSDSPVPRDIVPVLVILAHKSSPKLATPYHHRNIPHVAHIKLTTVKAPPVTRTRRSAILQELDRINHRSFDDEARNIRAHTASLLRSIYTPVIRPARPLPLTGLYSHMELPIPERITSDAYITRMLVPVRNVPNDINTMSYYPTRVNIGKGHLACVSYAGGKGYPRRNYLSKEHDRNIRDEITFRSYYKALDNPQVDGAKEAETVSLETQPLTS